MLNSMGCCAVQVSDILQCQLAVTAEGPAGNPLAATGEPSTKSLTAQSCTCEQALSAHVCDLQVAADACKMQDTCCNTSACKTEVTLRNTSACDAKHSGLQ